MTAVFSPHFQRPTRVSHVVFDWDGTVSFVRAGWGEVMLKQWMELIPRREGESEEELRKLAHNDIWRLNGKPSIHQAAQLGVRIDERGGRVLPATEYEHDYQRRLGELIQSRCEAIRDGTRSQDSFTVRGVRSLLDRLFRRGLRLHVASGTQRRFVQFEASLLGLDHYFEGRIHGPEDEHDRTFTKRGVLDSILLTYQVPASELLAFGDGHVEIEQAKAVGGYAVAVASDETEFGSGRIDEAKRQRLMGVGADLCIPDYHELDELLSLLLS
jgi:phosphoglycolate phosphatase-like HAD superfamily hydrolase